jgi:hypothetical protein
MSRSSPFRRIIALAVLLVASAGLALPAAAATKVRIEYVRLLRGGEDRTPNGQVLALLTGSGEAVTASATSVQSTAAPAFAADRAFSGGVYARVIAVQGAAIVSVGANPVATETGGVRVAVGEAPIYLPIGSGEKVAVIEAADPPTQVSSAAPSGVAPVTGSFTGTGNSANFTPIAGRSYNLAVWATGATAQGSALGGTVYLARSTDGGTTFLPITAAGGGIYSFTALANESLYESQAGVLYRLICSAYTSGTINYRFTQ